MEQLVIRNVDYGCRCNRHSTECGKTFGVIGLRLWNSIPVHIRSNDSFKKAL